jgi:hypothetical protein
MGRRTTSPPLAQTILLDSLAHGTSPVRPRASTTVAMRPRLRVRQQWYHTAPGPERCLAEPPSGPISTPCYVLWVRQPCRATSKPIPPWSRGDLARRPWSTSEWKPLYPWRVLDHFAVAYQLKIEPMLCPLWRGQIPFGNTSRSG